MISDNPAGVFTFYLAIFLPGPLLAYGFHAIFEIDDIGICRNYDEACQQACRDEYFHLKLTLSSDGYICINLQNDFGGDCPMVGTKTQVGAV